MPYVIVGHNQRIAWGFTNVGPTVADASSRPSIGGCISDAEGMAATGASGRGDSCKGKPDVTIDVKITRHGPIISDMIPGESRQVALRWTLYDGLRMPFFDVDTAQNWETSAKLFRNSTRLGKMLFMPMWMGTSAIRRLATFRFAHPAMAAYRSAEPTTLTNGQAISLSTNCPASTILLRV